MVRAGAWALTGALLLAGLSGCARGHGTDCDALQGYRGARSHTVELLAPASQVNSLAASMQPFKDCTGIDVNVVAPSNGTSVDGDVQDRVAGARQLPDLALVGHPGFRWLTARRDVLAPAAPTVASQLQENFAGGWNRLMSVREAVYGVPVDLEMKSLVWYSPGSLRARNVSVPSTWPELLSATSALATSGLPAGTKPWCDGFASAGNAGWPGTDWIESLVLQNAGADVFDKWVDHRIPFNDPHVLAAVGQVSSVLRNAQYTNGGLGGPAGIAQTPYADSGRPLLTGECYLHRAGSGIPWPEGTRIRPDGDVWVFPLPAGTDPGPVLGYGDIAVTFNGQPWTQALQTYFAGTAFARARARAVGSTGWASANRNVDDDAFATALDAQVSAWLRRDDVEFRYDGSDDMPNKIAYGVFWKQVQEWIAQPDRSDRAMLDAVEAAWPR